MAWYKLPERGSVSGLKFFFLICRLLGYTWSRFFCHFVVLYFFIAGREPRRHVKTFLIRATGRSRLIDQYLCFYRFAESILDRVFILARMPHKLFCHVPDSEVMDRYASANRGAFMLGSHLGPMEASRLHAEGRGYKISVLIYSAISPKLYSLLREISRTFEDSMIQVDSHSIDFILEVKHRLDLGHFIAVLGDRAWARGKTRIVPFLGAPAAFPLGPFELAVAANAPILLTFVLKSSKNQYDVYLEELTPGRFIPRTERQAHLESLQDRFIERLEYYVKLAPTQWYNFYDFWHIETDDSGTPPGS